MWISVKKQLSSLKSKEGKRWNNKKIEGVEDEFMWEEERKVAGQIHMGFNKRNISKVIRVNKVFIYIYC